MSISSTEISSSSLGVIRRSSRRPKYLSARHVEYPSHSRRLFAIIEGSKRLQRKLHLLPEPNTTLRTLQVRPNQPNYTTLWANDDDDDSDLRDLKIRIHPPFRSPTYGQGLERSSVSFSLDVERYAGLEAPQGARIRRMLLYQPPITTLKVEIGSCRDTSMGAEDYYKKLDSDDGVSDSEES